MTVVVCTGGPRAWLAAQHDCPRCYRRTTHFGWYQAWYDPFWTCGRCGAENGRRDGSPRRDRERALRVRAEFTAWLIAGSPPIEV